MLVVGPFKKLSLQATFIFKRCLFLLIIFVCILFIICIFVYICLSVLSEMVDKDEDRCYLTARVQL